MGILDELKRIAHPYEDEGEDELEDDVEIYSRSERKEKVRETVSAENERRSSKIVNLNATTKLQVVLVKPERFESVTEIADHLRDRRSVVMNMEKTPKEISRRILDFLAGVSYANEGKIKKIAVSTYIITPYNVDLMGDLVDELENNGLYL
ncbi:MAG: cell division protein SepF [Oscillospiraceae bacterium]|nr:cell division protein SepF [Oscillospiraceae bacterium]